jgi:hypothetical protein
MSDPDYPSEETIAAIKGWRESDGPGLITFLREHWTFPDYFSVDDGIAYMSTAGWSGNEEMVEAIPAMWWSLHWRASQWGGHHILRLDLSDHRTVKITVPDSEG